MFKMKKSVRIKVEKSGKNGNPVKEEKENMEKTFNVEGMMCSRCEAHVREAVGKIAGGAEVVADHNASKVTVKLSADVDDDKEFSDVLHKYNGKIIVFDDKDKLLTSRSGKLINMMKAIGDSDKKNRKFKNPEGKDEYFTGKLIFISNKCNTFIILFFFTF